MKVLLANGYFMRLDPKQWRQQRPYPPLGTLYAASVLAQEGHEVEIFDTTFCLSASDLKATLYEFKPDAFIVYDDGFNYLTKMCLTNMREAVFEMLDLAKKAGCKTLVSSSDSTDHSADYLQHGADAIAVGEGEITVKEWCVVDSTYWTEVTGLRWLNDMEVRSSAPRKNLQQLDILPFPDYSKINLQPYAAAWQNSAGYSSLNMVTTRGCPFKCNWCAKPIYGNRYNSRTPANVANELAHLVETTGCEHIWFADDIFGLKPGWVAEFANELAKRNLRVPFKIQSRADLLCQPGVVESLARAGADEVWMGAESGSQKVLDAMDKGITVEQIEEAVVKLKIHGIKPCLFLQFGYSGETKADIALTEKMLFNLMPHDIGISVSYPLPGTTFYENVKQQMGSKKNWAHSDELLAMFKSTYSPKFYRRLQRAVHQRFRYRQAIEKGLKPATAARFAQQAASRILVRFSR